MRKIVHIKFMNLGIMYMSNLLVGKNYTLRTLFRFNGHSWNTVDSPSEKYLNKMSRYAGQQSVIAIKKIFKGA